MVYERILILILTEEQELKQNKVLFVFTMLSNKTSLVSNKYFQISSFGKKDSMPLSTNGGCTKFQASNKNMGRQNNKFRVEAPPELGKFTRNFVILYNHGIVKGE